MRLWHLLPLCLFLSTCSSDFGIQWRFSLLSSSECGCTVLTSPWNHVIEVYNTYCQLFLWIEITLSKRQQQLPVPIYSQWRKDEWLYIADQDCNWSTNMRQKNIMDPWIPTNSFTSAVTHFSQKQSSILSLYTKLLDLQHSRQISTILFRILNWNVTSDGTRDLSLVNVPFTIRWFQTVLC